MNKLLLALLFPALALAEPLVSVNNLVTSDATYNVQAAPLDVAGKSIDALAKSVTWSFQQQTITFTVPPSPTPYTFTGLHIWYRVESGTGVKPFGWGGFDHLQAAKNVPAGIPVNCVYSAPTIGTGDLTCTPGPDIVAPSAPGALTASASGIDTVLLAWGAAADNVGVVSYAVERCSGAAGCVGYALVATSAATAFGDSGLAQGQTYSYRVRAADAAGNFGAYSNVTQATTLVPAPPPPPGPIASPDGTQIPAVEGKCDSTTIIEANGVTWFNRPFVGDGKPGQCAIDRALTATGAKTQVKGSVNFVKIVKGVIYTFDSLSPSCSSPFWEKWNGSSWTCSAAP